MSLRKANPLTCIDPISDRSVLAVHLYDEGRFDALLCKIRPLLEIADEVWLASANAGLLEKAENVLLRYRNVSRTILVDNRWHDWSGYLAFFREFDQSSRLIICNDSIVARRFISNRTLQLFISALTIKPPAIIGELDTSTCSVCLNGWSSVCWISTYMFAIRGVHIDVRQLESCVEDDVLHALKNPTHFFNGYLHTRRASLAIDDESKRAKLGAMFFERRLTRLAIESGTSIVDFCAGSRIRKIERVLERLHDA